MNLESYLIQVKQWRQRLGVDRLIILLLGLSNALLLISTINRQPAIELSLPLMDSRASIQPDGASQAFYEWWGLSLAELLGNLNSGNLSFVETNIQSLLSPHLKQQVQTTLNQQFYQLQQEQATLSFEPLNLSYEQASRTIKVSGHATLSSSHQRLSGSKTFRFQFDVLHYRPVLTSLQIHSDLK